MLGRKQEYEGTTCSGSFHERVKKMVVQLCAGEVIEVEAGFGLGEGHYTCGKVSLDLIVAIVVNGTVHAFSVQEAEILALSMKESAESLPDNPYAKIIAPKIAKDLAECIEQAKLREDEIRKGILQ